LASELTPIALNATFVGTGNVFPQTYRSVGKSPSYSYRSTYTGRSREATVSSLKFTVDGDSIPIPSNVDSTWAQIYKSTSGWFAIERNN
jgi:hypothetical protein